jgi:hypothetical protein
MKTLQQIEPRTPILSLPVTITNAGSYYLTSNLFCASCTNFIGFSFQNGVDVLTNGVTIDLNGFELTGSSPSGSAIVAGNVTNLCVRNGSIRNWTGGGVGLGTAVNSVIQNVRVAIVGDNGINVGNGALVEQCVARESSSGNGVAVGDGSTVRGCVASANVNGMGILMGNGCTVSDSSASSNFRGYQSGQGCTIRDCAAWLNSGFGINTADGCSVIGCTARSNGGNGVNAATGCLIRQCTVNSNSQNGILTGGRCSVEDCNASANGFNGIFVNQGSAVRNCTANSNGGDGIDVTENCQAVGNLCSTNFIDGILIAGNARGNRIEANHLAFNGYYAVENSATSSNNVVVRNTAIQNHLANFLNRAGGADDWGPVGSAATATSPWANISH